MSTASTILEKRQIPRDWRIVPIRETALIIDGDRGTNYPQGTDFHQDGFCLFLNAGNVTAEGFRFAECAFISEQKDALLHKGKLRRHDAVLTTRGTVGNVAYFDDSVPYDHIRINSGMVIIRPDTSAVYPRYFYLMLRSAVIQSQIERLRFGSAQPQLTVKAIASFDAVLPPIDEQQCVAAALSDVDALIGALDKLIEKKRAIKLASMQQLLKGRRRLSGHSAPWVTHPLNEVVTQFIVPMRDKPPNLGGDVPWCRIEDFDGKYLTESKSGQGVNAATITAMNLKVHPVGTLLVSCSADLGRCAIVKKPLVSNQTFIGLVFDDKKASNEFFYYYMSLNAQVLNDLSSGTTISYLSREKFESFKVTVPSSAEEQAAIGKVLSAMDLELAALEQRRDKTKLIKQGMMQALLTGKVRLV